MTHFLKVLRLKYAARRPTEAMKAKRKLVVGVNKTAQVTHGGVIGHFSFVFHFSFILRGFKLQFFTAFKKNPFELPIGTLRGLIYMTFPINFHRIHSCHFILLFEGELKRPRGEQTRVFFYSENRRVSGSELVSGLMDGSVPTTSPLRAGRTNRLPAVDGDASVTNRSARRTRGGKP